MGSLGLVGGVAGDIVDALVLVQFSNNKVIVGIVVDDELDVGEVTLAVREQLGQLDTVGENVCIVNESIVVAGVGTLPGQNHIVGVALVTEDHRVVRVHGSLIGDAQGAVRVTGVDHVGTGINCLGTVNLGQTSGGHLDGHNRLTSGGSPVSHREVAVSLLPGGNQIGAGFIGEEFQNHIVLVVGQTLAQSIDEGVAGQVGGFGSDAGQSGDNLVIDHIACRSGAGMSIAIGDVSAGTIILAGVVNVLTQSLLQLGNASEVLREGGHIIDPAGAAIGGIGAVDGGHGQGYQERIGGGYDHFGNCSFHAQVQTQLQIDGFGFAVSIGRSHLDAAVSSHVLFQCVLDSGGVCFQACSQCIDQHITLVEILGGIQLVSIGIPFSAVLQTQSLQEICTLHLVDAIQDFDMVVGTAICGRLTELDNICNFQVAELNTGNRIAEAAFAVAQIAGVICVTITGCADQSIVDILIVHTGGHIAGVPGSVLLSIGQINFVNSQGAFLGKVDGGIGNLSRGNTHGETQAQQKCHTQGDCLSKVFHFGSKPFVNSI